jgi:phenylpyruvate tautomerase PptA (4-oxalocrotonate tautomerase family)
MPLYDVEHITPLTDDQQETLAKAFTDLHSTRFKTPKFFINVRYTDARGQAVFRGGKRAVYNRLILRTRAAEHEHGQRSKHSYEEHCRDLIRVWERVVVGVGKEEAGSGQALRTVWVLGALTTAVECGIARPRVRSCLCSCSCLMLMSTSTRPVSTGRCRCRCRRLARACLFPLR